MAPSPSAPPAARAPAPPSRARRWAVRAAVGAALLAVTAWGLFTWLCYNPLASDAPALDRVVPASAAFAVRVSSEDLLGAPFVRRNLLGSALLDDVLRRLEIGLEEGDVAGAEAEVDAGLPGFLRGFTVRGDLLGRDTVVFGVPDAADPRMSRWAVATRLSPRARVMLSALKHGWVRDRVAARTGLRVVRTPVLYEVSLPETADPSLPRTLFAALERDVAVAGNDRDLVAAAAALARSGEGGALPDRPDAAGALAGESVAPVRGFVDLARVSRDAAEAGGAAPGAALRDAGGLAAAAGFLLDPDALGTLKAAVRFPGEGACILEASGVRADRVLEGAPAAMADAAPREAADALAEAAALAPAGSAVLAARVEMPVGLLLVLLHARAPEEVRGPIDDGLRRSGATIQTVARDADDVLQPGVSVVVERLPECDGLALDRYGADEEGRFVLPVAGVLLVFRQKPEAPSGEAERLVRRVREWMDLRAYEDLVGLPTGVTGFRATPKFLTQDLDLVRPAAAFQGDLVLVASNEGLLLRALEAREKKRPAFDDLPGFAAGAAEAGDGQAHAFVDAGPMLAMARDDRREVATRRCSRNWREVRRRVHSDVVLRRLKDRDEISQAEVQEMVDTEMERLQERNRTVEFDEEKARYLAEVGRWGALRSLAAGLSWDPAGVRLTVAVRAGE